MAIVQDGGYPLGSVGPINSAISTVNTTIAGKESLIEVYQGSVTRSRIATSVFTAAGNYMARTSSGTGLIAAYNSSDFVIYSSALTTDPLFFNIASTVSYWQISTSSGSAYVYVQNNVVNNTYSKNVTLTTITGSGNFGQGTGTAAGGTAGYTAGQVAHVVLVGGGGGGGGGGRGNSTYGTGIGGAGAVGGLGFSNTPITLTGTYAITIGTGGTPAQWAVGNGQAGSAGNAGNATTGFSLTGAAGTGGPGGPGGDAVPAAAAGTPSANNTQTGIYNPTTITLIGGGAGAPGGIAGPTQAQDPGRYGANTNGQSGTALVLRWTP